MLPKDDLLKSVEHRDGLARILDQADQAHQAQDLDVTKLVLI